MASTNIRVTSKSGRFIALLPPTLQGGFSVVVTASGINSFMASWPCSGLKEDKPVRFGYDAGGNLVDIYPDWQPDGEALLALTQDAQEFAERAIERRRNTEVK